MKNSYIYLLTALLALCCTTMSAQSLNDLNKALKQLEQEKQATTKLMSKTRSDRDVTVRDQKLLQNRIRNGRSIVSNLEKQTQILSAGIDARMDTIATMESQLQELRKEYAAMVCEAYKNYKLNNFMVFLFAAKDFNDATRRITYMRQYNRMRERKSTEIAAVSKELGVKVDQLVGKREEQEKLQKTKSDEITSLAKDEAKLSSSAKTLQQKLNTLSATEKKQQQEINNLQKKIAQQIAKASSENKATKKTAAQIEYDVQLTGRFDQNQGKLPYPVSGVIIDRHGIHRHATLAGVTVNNKGVNIASEAGADVRSVFEGVVTMVFPAAGMRNSIIIRHGNYLTAYSNLESISVEKGDKIAINQVIGRLSTSDQDDSKYVHFEIWRDSATGTPENLNPEKWLRQ